MDRETCDSIYRCTNKNPVAVCDDTDSYGRACAYCHYGVVSSVDHSEAVLLLRLRVQELEDKQDVQELLAGSAARFVVGLTVAPDDEEERRLLLAALLEYSGDEWDGVAAQRWWDDRKGVVKEVAGD